MNAREVAIPSGDVELPGTLALPRGASGVVLFAHGSGSSRHSRRNQQVAAAIARAGIGTLLFDLLSAEEEAADRFSGHLRFDIDLLASRLVDATHWLDHEPAAPLSIGYFGASTGGGAALVAAARVGDRIGAVVSRGGRPDLAKDALGRVSAPTLLIVGEHDETVIAFNQRAFVQLNCAKDLAIVPHATHLFEEAGALERVAELAVGWFGHHLREPAALAHDRAAVH